MADHAEQKHERPDTEEKPDLPQAGPHARPELTNPDSTPGAGALPPVDQDDPDMGATG